MKSKLEMGHGLYTEKQAMFSCPLCKESLFLESSSLKCKNKHTYDLSKKGVATLLKKKAPKSDVYDEKLFSARRNFIMSGAYSGIYDEIISFLNDKFNSANIEMLDLGCGEGSHAYMLMQQRPNTSIVGVDLSKEGVNLATDYLPNGFLPFLGDAFNLPLKEKSFDVILDFLSPIFFADSVKLLKDNGVIIKISPAEDYLKEIREALGLDLYSKEQEIADNIRDKANIIQEKLISYQITTDDYILENLIKMTPLTNHMQLDMEMFKNIKNVTISLKIYIIAKE